MESGGGSSDSAKAILEETATNSRQRLDGVLANIIKVRVTTSTGVEFDLKIPKTESVKNLIIYISTKLKVAKEKVFVLHKYKQLRDGTLQDNQVMDGSRLTLLPCVETGLISQLREENVLEALERLSSTQVNDFLAGKAALNLTMRFGNRLMLIQLHLWTVSTRHLPPGFFNTLTSNSPTPIESGSPLATTTTSSTSSDQTPPKTSDSVSTNSSMSSTTTVSFGKTPFSTTAPLVSQFEISIPLTGFPPKSKVASLDGDKDDSNLTDPVPTHLAQTSAPTSQLPLKTEDTTKLLTTTENANGTTNSPVATTTSSNSNNDASKLSASHSCSGSESSHSGSSMMCEDQSTVEPTLYARTLVEASRNLTQILKKLSAQESALKKIPPEDRATSQRQVALLDTMHRDDKGVYSGTFTGVLNPHLQDQAGKPKRDIGTILHILNDVLCNKPRNLNQDETTTLEASSSSTTTGDKTVTNLEPADESDRLSQENQATRGKMEHLRLIMEEQRARKRARREGRVAPCTSQSSDKSDFTSQPATVGPDTLEPMDMNKQSTGSEHQVCKLNSPEPTMA